MARTVRTSTSRRGARSRATSRRATTAPPAHLDAASTPLLDLIREFDARGG
jgi:hypothetical protein